MKQSNHFSKIYIIESLGAGEVLTGEILHKTIEHQIKENNLPIATVLRRCASADEFFVALKEAYEDASLRNEYPWIHIESHGRASGDGIVLSNDEFIGWNDLKPILTDINLATKCNLMLVMSACNGAFLGEILQPTDRAPCWGVIGPTKEVYPDDLMAIFRSLYTELLSTLDGDKALISLFMAAKSRDVDPLIILAMDLFKKAYAGYFESHCTDKEYWKRAKIVRNQLPKEQKNQSTIQDIVQLFKKQESSFFEEHKNKFFMCDLFPENITRFPITFADVKPNLLSAN